jgi:ATP-dependent RNA helicase MSS116
LDLQLHALYDVLVAHRAVHGPKAKVIVFFTTAKMTAFASKLFESILPAEARRRATGPLLCELHSRLSQSKRTKTSDEFRAARSGGTLFSSDVSARGLDFPGISLVVQVGLTSEEQYVHRLGRTARAGKEGEGLIILAPFERRFVDKLAAQVDIKPHHVAPHSSLHALLEPSAAGPGHHSPPLAHPMSQALSRVEHDASLASAAAGAYRAALGFMRGYMSLCGFKPEKLVAVMNEWAVDKEGKGRGLGLRHQPAFEARTVGMMGFKGVPGLIIEKRTDGGGRGQNQRGGGGRR